MARAIGIALLVVERQSRHVMPAGLRRCSREAPCRDDDVCARTGAGQGAADPLDVEAMARSSLGSGGASAQVARAREGYDRRRRGLG
ncbi:hypothetical protein WMF31_35525 [Sorangium sp. So ce1036]|uniref:hypothetical protein n=1 Tax=Sorangium sp. So ce1036 TaxID=3133328 RepID=UPI003F0E67AD